MLRRLALASLAAVLASAAVAATSERLERLNADETALSADQGANMHRLARLLSALEQLRRDPPPALLVSPDDARDAVRAAILVRAMTPDLQARALGYAQNATQAMRQRRMAAAQSEALFERDSLAADATPAPDTSADLGGPRSDQPLTPPDRLIFPVAGQITQRFGAPIAGGGRANGLTLAAAKGAQAISPAAGRVQYVGPVKGWGVIVILRLAGGYHLVLAGLERTSVQAGQSVSEGTPVGWVSDGRRSASELYLEVRDQGSPVDPARWLGRGG